MVQILDNLKPLQPDRVHEVCGPSAWSFTLTCASQTQGHFLWISEHWHSGLLNPLSCLDFVAPERLLAAKVQNQLEGLAAAEDALRSGVLSLVVVQVSAPLTLTAGRRLQLAAKEGRALCICIIPEGMGSNAAETRWQCNPLYDPQDSTLQQWRLIKNKSGTLGVWNVRWSNTSHRLSVVSKTAV